MSRFPIALVLSFLPGILAAQEPGGGVTERIAAITGAFESAWERDVEKRHADAIAALDAQYLAAVTRALEAATAKADLDEALAWREEKARIREKKPLPAEDAETLAPALAAMRKTYRESIARLEAEKSAAAAPLFEKIERELEALQVEFTKALRIDEALAVKTERERFAALRTERAPAAAPSTAAAIPAPGLDPPALPQWVQQAAESGGSLRVRGVINGKPIDERTVLKDFPESDYVSVAAGPDGLVLGVRRRGNGKRILLDQAVQGDHELREFRALQALDRKNDTWIADDHAFKSNGYPISDELRLGEKPVICGGGDGHLIRLASGDWLAAGHHWTNGETIQDALQPILDLVRRDNTSVLSSNLNRISWITADNRLRDFVIELRPGSVKEIPVATNPTEPIVELLDGAGKTFGQWVALGKSGAVYAERTGGFATPVAALSPAITLRCGGDISLERMAARRPDGTWHAVGPDSDLNEIVAAAGPALDLDIYADGDSDKTTIVLWIEPKTSMKPR